MADCTHSCDNGHIVTTHQYDAAECERIDYEIYAHGCSECEWERGSEVQYRHVGDLVIAQLKARDVGAI